MTMDMLVGDIFSNAARAAPGRVAARLGELEITFAEADRAANGLARALLTLGVGHRDNVAVWTGTSLDTIPVFIALAKLGAVFVPINGLLGADEAIDIVESAEPALLIVDAGRQDAGISVATRLGLRLASQDGLVAGSPPSGPDPGVDARDAGLPAVADLAALAAREAPTEVRNEVLRERDPHVIFFTSGSTGKPKGVILSHRASFLRSHPGALLEPRGAAVCPYPLFHMGAWTILLQQWHARDTTVYLQSANAADICHAIARYQATRMNAIPGVWRRIIDYVNSPDGGDADLSSLRFADTGTSATPIELLTAIEKVAPNAALRVFYGATESASVAGLLTADIHRKPGSVGVPSPLAEVRIDVNGELCVRGPLLFDGYYNNPEATAAALQDGWYRSGDLADVDADGYFSIVGRARDVIRTGGETVAPLEVESVLASHPAVADVAIVGLPDQQWGEVICAVIVLNTGQSAPTLEQLREHCEPSLARFKHPRRLAVVDAIPRTPATQQVQRRLLIEQLS